MADLDDLTIIPITEMSTDEAIEMLRQVRLSRRIPVRKNMSSIKRKQVQKPKIDADQASEILKILTG